MRLYSCLCGNTIFFENTICLACYRKVGWCPYCRAIKALEPLEGELYRCTDASCRMLLVKCTNYLIENVCNRCIAADQVGEDAGLCDYCRFNKTIPDLTVPVNRIKWTRIETAKRRLFYILDILELPYGTASEGFKPPLSFHFKGDKVPVSGIWHARKDEERVYTGHSSGKITINIREADDIEREKIRVAFGELHRTLIGHFRHEIAHYYWELLVRGRCEEVFSDYFGDHNNPDYTEALDSYYREGPPGNWRDNYVSAYATMHPWEDWAETFSFYLDMVSILETASNTRLLPSVNRGDLETMLSQFCCIGIAVNELNRTMGLKDLVPQVITPPVRRKLHFVHDVVCNAGELYRKHDLPVDPGSLGGI